jgi:predicted ribosome quality control (RQC) complex YloA/Tae2 family protein
MPRREPSPPRCFEYALPGGWRALAGRTDDDNERLSLEVAGPEDWWFHIRGAPGSHVVLQGGEGREPDRNTLKRAAAIAAHHSKARGAGEVSVSYTRAKYVTKPRGSPRGTVAIRKEKVIRVRPAAGEPAGGP